MPRPTDRNDKMKDTNLFRMLLEALSMPQSYFALALNLSKMTVYQWRRAAIAVPESRITQTHAALVKQTGLTDTLAAEIQDQLCHAPDSKIFIPYFSTNTAARASGWLNAEHHNAAAFRALGYVSTAKLKNVRLLIVDKEKRQNDQK